MKAIQRLKQAGYTRQQIADGLPGRTGIPLVRLYERSKRFPKRDHYRCLVELAEVRGLTLLARDFLDPDESCEP